MTLKELQEKRGRLVREAESVLTQSNVEKRDVSASENIRLDSIKSEIFSLDRKIASELAEATMGIAAQSRGADMPLEGYSILRAINGAASGRLDGLEREASDEIARRSGQAPSGFYVPNGALIQKRGMSVTGDSGANGANAVQTDVMDILEALRPLSRVISAGATLFGGLSSNLLIPKQAAASTASWKTEVAALDEVTSEIGQITLSPRRVGAFSELSNQLLVQSNGNVERFVRNDLMQAIASAIDAAAINGAGGAAPVGILETSGIGDVPLGTNGAALTWAHIVQLVGKVADANADFGSLAWLTNSKVIGKLRSTPKVASTDSVMILEGSSLLDYPVYGTNNVPSNFDKGDSDGICSAILFGNWEDVLIGQFGMGTDLIVDRFSKATNGITRLVSTSYVDIQIRRAESFAAAKDVLTS